MRSLILAAVAGLMLLSPPATGQYSRDYHRDFYQAHQRASDTSPEDLASYWYQKFLKREGEESGVATWAAEIRKGNSPDMVLASMLGGQEYYDLGGDTPLGFLVNLYRDIVGRDPTPAEHASFLRRMRTESRTDLAYSLLRRYPLSWHPPGPTYPPPEPTYDYRRPYYRYGH
jgi:hypothetical protein